MKIETMREKGQVVLILILVMTVALAIGLSVIQRSLSDISTASKVEQSSRAFSAAEAGIEKALLTDDAVYSAVDLGNNSTILAVQKNTVPVANQALEYPPLAKEEMAQVWLADPTSTANPPTAVYEEDTLDVYWGNSSSDQAALELTLVYYDGTYKSTNTKWYLDHNITRSPDNNFEKVACSGYTIGSNSYRCYKQLTNLPDGLVLLRARLLYNTASQPLAVKPTGTASLPVQARLFTSTGASGNTQRRIQVFKLDKVVPSYFDYAIFSAGTIDK